MSDENKIRSMLESAGFSDISVEPMAVDWSYGSFDEAWDFVTQVAGAIAAVVKELSEDEIGKLRSALETNMAPFQTESGLTLPGVTINASVA